MKEEYNITKFLCSIFIPFHQYFFDELFPVLICLCILYISSRTKRKKKIILFSLAQLLLAVTLIQEANKGVLIKKFIPPFDFWFHYNVPYDLILIKMISVLCYWCSISLSVIIWVRFFCNSKNDKSIDDKSISGNDDEEVV